MCRGALMSDIRLQFEAAVWAMVAVVAWAASAHFNVANTVAEFTRRHEEWQLDEFFTLIVFLSIAAFIMSLCQSRRHYRKRRAAEREAFTVARRDVLTGLPNRRMFLELAGIRCILVQPWSKTVRSRFHLRAARHLAASCWRCFNYKRRQASLTLSGPGCYIIPGGRDRAVGGSDPF